MVDRLLTLALVALGFIRLQAAQEAALAPLGTFVYRASLDFSDTQSGDVPYYYHDQLSALAINARKTAFRGKFARATTTFEGETGSYNVTITALGEVDGECEYRFLVNGVVAGIAKNSRVDADYGVQNHTFSDILVPTESAIAVESNAVSNGLVPENGAFAFARGRWTLLTLEPNDPEDPELPEATSDTDNLIKEETKEVTAHDSSQQCPGQVEAYDTCFRENRKECTSQCPGVVADSDTVLSTGPGESLSQAEELCRDQFCCRECDQLGDSLSKCLSRERTCGESADGEAEEENKSSDVASQISWLVILTSVCLSWLVW